MGRSPCCEKEHTNKGSWTKEEDERLLKYIKDHGDGCWRSLPKAAGLQRCGKSCRLRWINYLRPDLKRGNFTEEEDERIISLHSLLGNKWSLIAARLPGRTDNEIKNYWNTHIRRKLLNRGIDPQTHRPLNTTTTTANSDASMKTYNENHRKNVQTLQFQAPIFTKLTDDQLNHKAANMKSTNTDSAEDSNSSSILTEELHLHPQLNLELSISPPQLPPEPRAINTNDFKHQQQQNFGASITSNNVDQTVCLCYQLGFQSNSECQCKIMADINSDDNDMRRYCKTLSL